MSSETNNAEFKTVPQIVAWVTSEIASQVETVKQLSAKVEALHTLIEASGVIEKVIFAEADSALLPSSCALDITCLPPNITNLHTLEFTSDSVPYRWSGPGTATKFTLAVDRTKDKYLMVEILGAICPAVVASVSIHIDGIEMVANISDSGLTSTLPAQPTSPPFTEIILRLATTVSPNSLNGSDDTRLLGVAISGLSIK